MVSHIPFLFFFKCFVYNLNIHKTNIVRKQKYDQRTNTFKCTWEKKFEK